VIEGQGQVDHRTDGDAVIHAAWARVADDHDPLLDHADAKNGALWLVDNRRSKERAADTVVGDCECAALNLVGLQFTRPGPVEPRRAAVLSPGPGLPGR